MLQHYLALGNHNRCRQRCLAIFDQLNVMDKIGHLIPEQTRSLFFKVPKRGNTGNIFDQSNSQNTQTTTLSDGFYVVTAVETSLTCGTISYLGLFFSVVTRNSWTSMPVESVYSWLESSREKETEKRFVFFKKKKKGGLTFRERWKIWNQPPVLLLLSYPQVPTHSPKKPLLHNRLFSQPFHLSRSQRLMTCHCRQRVN